FNLVAQKKALFEGVFDPATNDINFQPGQAASLLSKMATLVPQTQAAGDTAGIEDGTKVEAGGLESAACDSVAKTPTDRKPSGSREGAGIPDNAREFDVTPAVAALAKLAGREPPAQPSRIRLSEENGEVRLAIPKPALELLAGLRPVLEILLQLGSGTR
ncbi:MAG: hypothetical protein PHF00_12385, partial [Elusimicrobia bacterium]|nr:hypothetical protein [Elusimicrobiota bacterium]